MPPTPRVGLQCKCGRPAKKTWRILKYFQSLYRNLDLIKAGELRDIVEDHELIRIDKLPVFPSSHRIQVIVTQISPQEYRMTISGGPASVLLPAWTFWRDILNFVKCQLSPKLDIYVHLVGARKESGWIRVIGVSTFKQVQGKTFRAGVLRGAYFRGRRIIYHEPGYRYGQGDGAVVVRELFWKDEHLFVDHDFPPLPRTANPQGTWTWRPTRQQMPSPQNPPAPAPWMSYPVIQSGYPSMQPQQMPWHGQQYCPCPSPHSNVPNVHHPGSYNFAATLPSSTHIEGNDEEAVMVNERQMRAMKALDDLKQLVQGVRVRPREKVIPTRSKSDTTKLIVENTPPKHTVSMTSSSAQNPNTVEQQPSKNSDNSTFASHVPEIPDALVNRTTPPRNHNEHPKPRRVLRCTGVLVVDGTSRSNRP
ncbi:hypothetical protein B0H66DRAFT_587352 [Apodospora peruviana]|uniref:Uncharacterized protein n=1 Tax=Apodospora peruviana TaxID=516989 RepID=A0AAE0MFX0_9PEZI|nr:hypothetical protein B0H66DRAFT_587352 [Apodospora peruviana]